MKGRSRRVARLSELVFDDEIIAYGERWQVHWNVTTQPLVSTQWSGNGKRVGLHTNCSSAAYVFRAITVLIQHRTSSVGGQCGWGARGGYWEGGERTEEG